MNDNLFEMPLHGLCNHLRCYLPHASKVAAAASLVSIYRAGPAWQVDTDAVAVVLMPWLESRKGVRGPPDADNLASCHRREMHISAVHRQHHVEMAHEDEARWQVRRALSRRWYTGRTWRTIGRSASFRPFRRRRRISGSRDEP